MAGYVPHLLELCPAIDISLTTCADIEIAENIATGVTWVIPICGINYDPTVDSSDHITLLLVDPVFTFF